MLAYEFAIIGQPVNSPSLYTCVIEMCTDMCVDMCVDRYAGMSMRMRINVRIDMCMEVFMVMCMYTCMDMRIDTCKVCSTCVLWGSSMACIAWRGKTSGA